MTTFTERLQVARKRAHATAAEIDEGLLKMAAALDRLVHERAELLTALEEVLEQRNGSDFIEKGVRARARSILEKAKRP